MKILIIKSAPFCTRHFPTPTHFEGCSCARIPGTGEGKVEFREEPKDATWLWVAILGILFFLATSWLASIACRFAGVSFLGMHPLSFLEVIAVQFVLALCAVALVVAIALVIVGAIALLLGLSCLGNKIACRWRKMLNGWRSVNSEA